jgi:hypothetical protein
MEMSRYLKDRMLTKMERFDFSGRAMRLLERSCVDI